MATAQVAPPVLKMLERLNLVGLVMPAAPIGAFGAIAFRVGEHALASLAHLGVAMLSSKAAAGVTGAGCIPLAATLPTVPVAGVALILGDGRLMSECRSVTNLIGNAAGTIVVARWEGALDRQRLREVLA